MSSTLLCADIGGSYIRVAQIEDHSAVTHRRSAPTPTESTTLFLETVQQLVESINTDAPALHISLAGLQDPETGLCNAANIPGLGGILLADRLTAALGKTVLIGNDADCFTLAESHAGAAAGHKIVFGVILGTGVGGGLVLNGRNVTGAQGLTGEWGHGPFIRPSESAYPYLRCECGQMGCLETIGGARGLERLHLWLHGASRPSIGIIESWHDGDNAATETMTRYTEILTDALAIIVNVTGATCLPVGGGLGSDTRLIETLDFETRRKILRQSVSPLIVKAKLGQDAGLIGASYL